jgi:hypothetical protein
MAREYPASLGGGVLSPYGKKAILSSNEHFTAKLLKKVIFYENQHKQSEKSMANIMRIRIRRELRWRCEK